MTDEKPTPEDSQDPSRDVSRRDFVAMSVAAGVAAAASRLSAADMKVIEKEIVVKTADGMCDAAFIHPETGDHPGVIVWADAFGLRPVMREIGRRLAAEGYSVLVPNPYYRIAKAPVFDDPSSFDFSKPADREKISKYMGPIQAPGIVERDAVTFVTWLDTQPQVNMAKKIGTHGYCMGGALVVRTAAAVRNRIGAGASFHGGGLVTAKPDSPHLLAPKIKATMYFGIASNDDKQQPDAKDKLREAFAAANNPAEIEVYPSLHGWCIRDMPFQSGVPIYNRPDAEKAWDKLEVLYKKAFA